MPDNKVDALAKILDATRAQLLGQREKFDMLGIAKSVGDHRKCYGEVAIHFISGAKSILLPISEGGRSDLYASLDSDRKFVEIQSLDNRGMFVRRETVADIFFSSETYDDYGPEDHEDHLGVLPDDEFWKIVEHLDCTEAIEEEFEQSRMNMMGVSCISFPSHKVREGQIDAAEEDLAEASERCSCRNLNALPWRVADCRVKCNTFGARSANDPVADSIEY